MLALLALVALGLIAYESGSPKSSEPTPAQQDLLKLGSASKATYDAVVALLGAPNPTALIQYAAQLSSAYPALAAQMGDMAVKLTTTMPGKSGTTWTLWKPSPTTTEVMLGTMPVLRYTDFPMKLLSITPAGDSATLAKARSDFNV